MAGAELKKQLDEYAALYVKVYGHKEALADLIPFMLEAFLASDRAFQKAMRGRQDQHDTKRPVTDPNTGAQSD